jgi:Fic family protein
LQKRGPLVDVCHKKIDDQYRILNTFTSNAIEGNGFSLKDTKLWLEDGITVSGKSRHDLFEVEGHGIAFDYMLQMARGYSLYYISSHLLDITLTLH